MADEKLDLEKMKEKLAGLLEARSAANCNTRHLSASDIMREEEIEELEEEIALLEKQGAK